MAAHEAKLPLLAQLRRLVQEFNQKAETIAQTIISEMSLPRAQKTYKPKTDMGGIAGTNAPPPTPQCTTFLFTRSPLDVISSTCAGGEKYMVEGIFFKFAIDLHGIYGGNAYALKVTNLSGASIALPSAADRCAVVLVRCCVRMREPGCEPRAQGAAGLFYREAGRPHAPATVRPYHVHH